MTATLSRCARVLLAGPLAALAVLAFVLPAAAQTVYWELEPVHDPAIEIGTYTAVGGRTSPDGVHFKLTNNRASQPQILTLVATSGGPLTLTAFKDGAPFLEQATDASGKLTVRFRTGEDMKFRVVGAQGASYQLSVWRGPPIEGAEPPAMAPMSSVIGSGGAARGASAAAPGPAQPDRAEPAQAAGGRTGMLMHILLGGILVALVAIAVGIFLTLKRKAAT